MTSETGTASDPHGAAFAVLLAGLEAVTVPPAGLPALRAAPQASLERFPLADLGLDSLGRMEFCIQLELDHGVPLTPDRLLAMGELAELLTFIASAGAPP